MIFLFFRWDMLIKFPREYIMYIQPDFKRKVLAALEQQFRCELVYPCNQQMKVERGISSLKKNMYSTLPGQKAYFQGRTCC